MTGSLDPNRAFWDGLAGRSSRATGWTDPGEAVALGLVADEVRGEPVLDVGVGSGRSTDLLLLLAGRYVAVDYSPAMVAAARRRHPGTDIRRLDARRLTGIPDESFALVVFSHCGIDSLDRAGREQAVAELHRVLRRGGLLVFSTLNLDGEFFRSGPGPARTTGRSTPVRWARFLARLARHPVAHALGWRHHRAIRHTFRSGPGWALDAMPTHGWRLTVHFTTAARAVADCAATGLDVEALVSREGDRLTAQAPTRTAWFHVVCRRR